MLQNTFCHVAGVGPKTERRLWSAGLDSWEAVRAGGSVPLSRPKAERLQQQVEVSAEQLAARNVDYFSATVPAGEHWRLFREFGDSAAYLDIETTGLGGPGDYITTIALYDGRSIKHYVHGDNLAEFKKDIGRYRLIITYNGKTFDVPFLRQYLGVPMDQAHIDLRYVLAGLGHRGGLKSCERQFGLERKELADVDGFFAVLLWQEYRKKGSLRALETLLAYNITDVINLALLMPRAYNLKLRDTPFVRSHQLSAVPAPAIPFRADAETIARIQREHFW